MRLRTDMLGAGLRAAHGVAADTVAEIATGKATAGMIDGGAKRCSFHRGCFAASCVVGDVGRDMA